MNRQSILRQTKLEMKRWIEQVDFENANEIKEKLLYYFEVLDAIHDLPEAPPKKVQPEKNTEKEKLETNDIEKESTDLINSENDVDNDRDKEIESVETIEGMEEKKETEEKDRVKTEEGYIVERKLRGAILTEINAFIPEGILRKLDIEHGDRVEARKMEDASDDGRNRYHYTLIEKGDGKDAPDRTQMEYCVIEKEGGMFVVKSSSLTGEEIKFNGVSYPIVLNEMDIRHFSLQEGDIIDIAYRKSMPTEHKVLWKHEDIEMPHEKTGEWSRKKKGNDQEKDLSDDIEPTLDGVTVMIVGNEGSRTSYQEQVEKRGGELLWIDAKEKVERFEPLVKKSSFTIFLLGLSGHTGMKKIKALCKEYKIPFEATFNQGITSIIRLAEDTAEKLKKTKNENVSALV
ncbi:hypothetical protein JMA_43580 (plasmid) [Jeotgalibacillus malaysiensis]|uniref:DUF2325 domain-containing protein n=1 Tax=Jeotgalibacillus malaysiensis TaxID=1508404 RepID=A0A0B5ATY1_9BACL|nr:DUF2325 domain-containing protein [Jeotgalibacillus malaysiensis]AJD93675.1 hypothetical protein JMA_43580 [Jeotgalibacillus malaysiensis]